MPDNPRVLSRSTRLPNEQKEVATASCHPIHNECQILGPYRQVRRRETAELERNVVRRWTCDREIWTKPLAACGGRGQAMGFAFVFGDRIA